MPHSPLTLREFTLRLLIAAAVTGLALLLWRIADVLLLAFGAALVAVLLRSIAAPISERAGVREPIALAASVLLVASVLAGTGWLFGHELSSQFDELLRRLPRAWDSARSSMQKYEVGRVILDSLEDPSASLGIFAAKLPSAAAALSAGLLNALLVAFGAIYMAINPAVYRNGFLKLFPAEARPHVQDVVETSARALQLWLRSQLITMCIVGVLTGAGLWLAGVPAPLALGLLAGLLEFVPYIGPILAAVPGLLLALSVGPEIVLYALLVYLAVQQLESNFVLPMVQREVLKLPPALVIFAVVALGVTFGTLGWIFAAPLTVLLVVVVGKVYVREALGTPTNVPGEQKGRAAPEA